MKFKTFIMVLITAMITAGLTYYQMRKSISAPITAAETATGGEASAKTEGMQIAGLKTAFAVIGRGWSTISATGKVTVLPDRMVKITPRIAGKVVSAHGTVGDMVSRGQVLAVISSMELAEARSSYSHARTKLKAAESSYERELQIVNLGANSMRPVEEARTENLSAQGDLSDARSDLAQAKSDLLRDESELMQCRARLERAKELFASKIISKHDMETADFEYKRDLALVERAKAKIGQAESRIESAKSKTEISSQYLTREEKVYKGRVLDMRSLQTAKNEIASANIEIQAALDRIKLLGGSASGIGDTIRIVSPISGRIISRNTNIGEMASPDNALFTVANLDQVWIETDVYEKDLARVQKGQIVEILVDTYPNRTFNGHVDSISDLLNTDSRTAKVRCIVENSKGLLRGEMFARISILVGKQGSTVLLPKQSVLDEAGAKIVFTRCTECKEDKIAGKPPCGSFDKIVVTTGPIHEGAIEVLSGIKPGMEVVTDGAYQLKTALGSGKLSAGCADGH